jgi:hypothetical protein
MKSAKELCAMLITRSIQDLNVDEEEIVVDYLTDLGFDVDLDTKPRELCRLLLETTMKREFVGKNVPMTAYANSLLTKEKNEAEVKKQRAKRMELNDKREASRRKLERREKELPGCDVSNAKIFQSTLYDIIFDPELGYDEAEDIHRTLVKVNEAQYNELFVNVDNPIIEITSNKGDKAFARVDGYHHDAKNVIFASQLVLDLLNVKEGVDRAQGFVKLCNTLPNIAHIKFTYYGSQEILDEDLEFLPLQLPKIINGYSYLSLGMVLTVHYGAREPQVRVESLEDPDNRPIFAGLVPFGENDIPFDIEPDI